MENNKEELVYLCKDTYDLGRYIDRLKRQKESNKQKLIRSFQANFDEILNFLLSQEKTLPLGYSRLLRIRNASCKLAPGLNLRKLYELCVMDVETTQNTVVFYLDKERKDSRYNYEYTLRLAYCELDRFSLDRVMCRYQKELTYQLSKTDTILDEDDEEDNEMIKEKFFNKDYDEKSNSLYSIWDF